MGRLAHALLPAADHDLGVALRDLLVTEGDRPKSRTAKLIQRPRGAFHRDTRLHRRLTRRTLARAGLQDLAENNLIHVGGLHTRPLQRGADGDGAQFVRWKAG